MPRACSVCLHPNRATIDERLVSGEASVRALAKETGLSRSALERHRDNHIPAHLAEAAQAAGDARGRDLMAELERCFARVNKLFDACDSWLTDPDDPARYNLGPRAGDIKVIYSTPGLDGKAKRSKAQLSTLLDRLEAANEGMQVMSAEIRHADPRELVLKTAERLQGQLELLAKIMGKIKEEGATVNVLVTSPEWVSTRGRILAALAPYPEARVAVAEALSAPLSHAGQ